MKKLLLTLFILYTTVSIFTQDPGERITGFWKNDNKTVKIEVTKDEGIYSGKIIWVDDKVAKKGNPTLLGTTILSDLKYSDNKWTGSVYVPQKSKSFDCSVTLDGNDTLLLEVTKGFFSRTKRWTRVK